MIEIKCGEGKIVIGEPCPPITSFFFPIESEKAPNKEEGNKNDDAPQSP
jgi:hypothetical protein